VRAFVGAVLLSAGLVTPAAAQTPRWEFGIGALLTGRESAGTTNASLLSPGGDTVTLFRTTNRITSGLGVESQLSWRLRERLRAEIAFGWVSADLESRVSGDFEDVVDVSLTQGLQQFRGEVAVAYRLLQRGRWSAFVRGGAGGFREITTDKALVGNGTSASLGGVAHFLVRQAPSGLFGRIALRFEARAVVRQGGVKFGNDGARVSPAFVAGLVIGR